MNRIFSVLLILLAIHTAAQTRYVLRQIDFQSTANSEFCKPQTDNLAVILVDAYLNGKLTAYTAGPLDSLIAGLEFPKRSLRETDAGKMKKRPERKKTFANVFKRKSAVKITTADLKPLTKAEFLRQMVILEDETTTWNKTTRYERGKGLVYHKGAGYFPRKDTVGIEPPNKTFWELAYNGNLPFYFRIPDLPAVSVFGKYVETDRKDAWQPLLVRVTRTQEVPDYLVDMTVSFKYEEVMKYLVTIGQPLLYKTEGGYTGGGTFVLGEDEKVWLFDKVRQQAIDNSTFKSNIAVSSMVGFASFLDESDKYPEVTLFQVPSGKEFRLYRQNIPVAVIPTGAVEQMLNFPKTEQFTWSQALSNDMFNKYEIALSGVTCDLPFVEVPEEEADVDPRTSYFLEKYLISTVGATEQKRLRSRFTNLLKFVNAQFKAGTLLPVEERDSYFRARFDWSTLPEVRAMGPSINKTYWANLLHHDDISDVRYPYYWSENENITFLHKKLDPLRSDSLEFGVTYKRVVAPAKGKPSFEPYQVSLRSLGHPGADSDQPLYTYNWADLKKAVVKGKDPLLVELVKLAETFDLSFTSSQLIYGVIEDAPAAVAPVAKKK